jgi:hypothetical protein
MIRYKTFDTSRGLFLTINLEEQLMPGSFEHTLNYLIDQLDLSPFDAAFHNDEKGAPAYPPKEWSGTIEELKKKRKDAERLIGNIIAQHIALDKEGKASSGLNEMAASYGYDKEYRERHLKRLQKNVDRINRFLEEPEERK